MHYYNGITEQYLLLKISAINEPCLISPTLPLWAIKFNFLMSYITSWHPERQTHSGRTGPDKAWTIIIGLRWTTLLVMGNVIMTVSGYLARARQQALSGYRGIRRGDAIRRQTDILPIRQEESGEENCPWGNHVHSICERSWKLDR